MTEKRFTAETNDWGMPITDHIGKEKYHMNSSVWVNKLVDLLNQLHEEKEIDEKCYKELLQRYDKLKEENEQLKQRIEDYNKALKTLQDVYERKDRQLQRAKKDTRKYTDYFMNELNWDCDRIIEEVFR